MAFPTPDPTNLSPYQIWTTPALIVPLIYRARDGVFGSITRGLSNAFGFAVFGSDPSWMQLYEQVPVDSWVPVKFNSLPGHHQRALVPKWGRASSYLNLRTVPYRTPRTAGPQGFKSFQSAMMVMAKGIRAARRELVDGDAAIAVEDAVAFAERNVTSHYHYMFAKAFNDMSEKAGKSWVMIEHCDCGHLSSSDEVATAHDSNTYCESCAEDLREIDGELHHLDDCYYWDSDGEYHLDPEPEEDDDDNSGEPYSRHIRSWGCTASSERLDHAPHSDRNFTLGVELEVECSDYDYFADSISDTHDQLNDAYRYAMFKRDGSLSSKGFEIVTAARPLADHIKQFAEWKPHNSLSAWKHGHCGVHVHVDSRAFTALSLGKFLMFINADANAPFIKSIAGRHPREGGDAQRYCAQLGAEVLESPDKALKSSFITSNTRYRMVNLTNLSGAEQERLKTTGVYRDSKGDYSTVELRIFRASLKKERLLAQIEFTHAAVIFCRTASYHELTGDAFKTWLEKTAFQYKNLARWYGIRIPKANKKATVPTVREREEVCA